MPSIGDEVIGAVLAGGLGTRLRAAVADRPKVLALVHGRPFLAYLLDQFAGAGVRQTVLLTGYMADRVEAEFGRAFAGMSLAYSPEPQPLGTGGALRHALPLLTRPTVLVLNGDSYCDLDPAAFFAQHQGSGAEATLALTAVADASRYGKVRLSDDGRVERFEEKQAGAGPGWINAGVYLLARRLVEEVPAGRAVSLERDVFPGWAASGRCRGYRAAGRFLDIGTPESYAEAATFFARDRPS
jgi:NDP-sugar pyrophosphorylase family protein